MACWRDSYFKVLISICCRQNLNGMMVKQAGEAVNREAAGELRRLCFGIPGFFDRANEIFDRADEIGAGAWRLMPLACSWFFVWLAQAPVCVSGGRHPSLAAPSLPRKCKATRTPGPASNQHDQHPIPSPRTRTKKAMRRRQRPA
jgi:hypothetical protein